MHPKGEEWEKSSFYRTVAYKKSEEPSAKWEPTIYELGPVRSL